MARRLKGLGRLMSSLPCQALTEVPSGALSLSDALISEVVRAIVANERSGDLIVESGETARKVMFDRGAVVFASSNVNELRLGDLMVQSGSLSQSQLETALQLAKRDGSRIGKAIESAGFLSAEQVASELTRQISAIATSIYSLRVGSYRFDEHPCRIPEELRVRVSPYRIQFEGIRRLEDSELVEQALGSQAQFVKVSDSPPFRIEDVALEPAEARVRQTALQPVTIENLVSTIDAERRVTVRIVYGFLSSGLMAKTDAPAEREEVPTSPAVVPVAAESAPTASVTDASPEPDPVPHSRPDNREEITRLFNEIKVRQMVQDREGVASMLQKVVYLAPDNPKYVAMLAKALGAIPARAKSAEPMFRRALTLDPDNAQLHYEVALYYRSMGMPSRALAELKTALRIDPGLAEARRVVVEMKQTGGGAITKSLKKLFS